MALENPWIPIGWECLAPPSCTLLSRFTYVKFWTTTQSLIDAIRAQGWKVKPLVTITTCVQGIELLENLHIPVSLIKESWKLFTSQPSSTSHILYSVKQELVPLPCKKWILYWHNLINKKSIYHTVGSKPHLAPRGLLSKGGPMGLKFMS